MLKHSFYFSVFFSLNEIQSALLGGESEIIKTAALLLLFDSQICRFCWHRIRTDENGLCPACRKAYPENPADFKPLSQEEVARLKAEKRHKDQQRKQKITENRKHLANVRVVQRNLVFVVGLPIRLADAEVCMMLNSV